MLRDKNLNLMQAVISYDLKLIKELVESGVDIHCEDDFVFNIASTTIAEQTPEYIGFFKKIREVKDV